MARAAAPCVAPPPAVIRSPALPDFKPVPAPTRHVAPPRGSAASVRIGLKRECGNRCADFTLELSGKGSGHFEGDELALLPGRHDFTVPAATVACLAKAFDDADFWSLADQYAAPINDQVSWILSLTVGGKTKTLEDYTGQWVGMPPAVLSLESAVYKLAAQRFVDGDADTLATLAAEKFDFKSSAAAALLAKSVQKGSDAFLLGLLARGVSPNGVYRPYEDEPPATSLDLAVLMKRNAVARAMLDAGALQGATPAQAAEALRFAARAGNAPMVAEILKYHPDVNAMVRDLGTYSARTALTLVNENDDLFQSNSPEEALEITRLLIAAGADARKQDGYGYSPLHFASSAEQVRLLLAAGADIEARDENGNTPILDPYSDEAMAALIEAGADLTARNRRGEGIFEGSARGLEPKSLAALAARGVYPPPKPPDPPSPARDR